MSTGISDLRHMTSSQGLSSHRLSHRLSQHLRTSPARSPTSIPSSPTSVHSSSSAIFERDIEPISSPSSQSHTTNAHRIPRSKTTEQIEHSVPSVLDSAAAILSSMEGTNDVAVVAPAPYTNSFAGSGFASPIGSFRSRSPSPTIGSLAAQGRNSLLLSVPQQQRQSLSGSPPQPSSIVRPTPSIQTTNTSPPVPAPPSIVTPTSAYYSVADGSETGSASHPASEADGSPTTTTREHPFSPLPSTSASASSVPAPQTLPSTQASPSSAPNPILSPLSVTSPAPPISPTSPASSASLSSASKRLSFISYADLLTSTPTSTLPLSSLTTAASAIEPPPHITGVAGLAQGPVSGAAYPGSAGTSLRGFVMSPQPNPQYPSSPSSPASAPLAIDAFGPTSPNVAVQNGSIRAPSRSHSPGRHDSMALAMLGPGSPAALDDVGGEWEREGLGRGLEERLDVLYGAQA